MCSQPVKPNTALNKTKSKQPRHNTRNPATSNSQLVERKISFPKPKDLLTTTTSQVLQSKAIPSTRMKPSLPQAASFKERAVVSIRKTINPTTCSQRVKPNTALNKTKSKQPRHNTRNLATSNSQLVERKTSFSEPKDLLTTTSSQAPQSKTIPSTRIKPSLPQATSFKERADVSIRKTLNPTTCSQPVEPYTALNKTKSKQPRHNTRNPATPSSQLVERKTSFSKPKDMLTTTSSQAPQSKAIPSTRIKPSLPQAASFKERAVVSIRKTLNPTTCSQRVKPNTALNKTKSKQPRHNTRNPATPSSQSFQCKTRNPATSNSQLVERKISFPKPKDLLPTTSSQVPQSKAIPSTSVKPSLPQAATFKERAFVSIRKTLNPTTCSQSLRDQSTEKINYKCIDVLCSISYIFEDPDLIRELESDLVPTLLSSNEYNQIRLKHLYDQFYYFLFFIKYTDKNPKDFINMLQKDYGFLYESCNTALKESFNVELEYFSRCIKNSQLPKKHDLIVHRMEYLWEIHKELLILKRGTYLVLVGEGGYGKETLAADALNNYFIAKKMGFNIFWLNLRECSTAEKILAKLIELNDLVGDSRDFQYIPDTNSNIRRLKLRLRSYLNSTPFVDCLLVLCGVENAETIDAFDLDCKIFITTLHKNLISDAIKMVIPIKKGFTLKESEQFFLKNLKQRLSLHSYEQSNIRNVQELCNGHPLIITEIVKRLTALMKANAPTDESLWKCWIDYLRNNKKLDFNQITQQSLKHLNENVRQYYYKLVIFPYSVDIPIACIRNYWSTDSNETYNSIQELNNVSLLELEYDENDNLIVQLNYVNYIFLQHLIPKTEKQMYHKEFVDKCSEWHRTMLHKNGYTIYDVDRKSELFCKQVRNSIKSVDSLLLKNKNTETDYQIASCTEHSKEIICISKLSMLVIPKPADEEESLLEWNGGAKLYDIVLDKSTDDLFLYAVDSCGAIHKSGSENDYSKSVSKLANPSQNKISMISSTTSSTFVLYDDNSLMSFNNASADVTNHPLFDKRIYFVKAINLNLAVVGMGGKNDALCRFTNDPDTQIPGLIVDVFHFGNHIILVMKTSINVYDVQNKMYRSQKTYTFSNNIETALAAKCGDTLYVITTKSVIYEFNLNGFLFDQINLNLHLHSIIAEDFDNSRMLPISSFTVHHDKHGSKYYALGCTSEVLLKICPVDNGDQGYFTIKNNSLAGISQVLFYEPTNGQSTPILVTASDEIVFWDIRTCRRNFEQSLRLSTNSNDLFYSSQRFDKDARKHTSDSHASASTNNFGSQDSRKTSGNLCWVNVIGKSVGKFVCNTAQNKFLTMDNEGNVYYLRP